MSGWTVYDDKNNNGRWDTGEPTATTDSLGNYNLITSSNCGACHSIRLQSQSGWRITYPTSGYWITSDSNQCNINFGVTQQGMITGTVFSDPDQDGVKQSGDSALSGLTVSVTDDNGNAVGTPTSTTTDSNGKYTIRNLPTGEDLTVQVSDAGNWGSQYINLNSGDNIEVDFPEFRSLLPPSNLTGAFGTDHTQVNLQWTNNSGGTEQGFHVYESLNGGAFSLAATLSSGTTSDTITGLSTTSDYVFEVASYDSNGDSNDSNTADAAAPSTPTEVDTTALLDGNGVASVTINWTPGANVPSGTTYDLYRSTSPTQPSTPYMTSLTGTSVVDTGVSSGQSEYYWVSAVSPNSLGGVTPQSGGTNGGQATVPNQDKTVTYNRPISAPAGAIANTSNNEFAVGEFKQTIKEPKFGLSGTVQSSTAKLTYTDAAFLMAVPDPGFNGTVVSTGKFSFTCYNSDSSGNIQPPNGLETKLDSGTLKVKMPSALPAYHVKTRTPINITPNTGSNGLADAWFTVDAGVQVCGGNPGIIVGAVAGFFSITYTYT